MSYKADVAVVGAGVFGAWTAYQLRKAGADVLLIDAYGPANSRASSGGESRILRLGYGPDEIYTRMAQRSLELWQQLFAEIDRPQLFQPTGVLWLAREHDAYCDATLKTFRQHDVTFARLERGELSQRYPQLEFGPIAWGMLENGSGVLLARQAVLALVTLAQSSELLTFKQRSGRRRMEPPDLSLWKQLQAAGFSPTNLFSPAAHGCQSFFPTAGGIDSRYQTRGFLPGHSGGRRSLPARRLPAWIDFNDLVYGIPNLENRGVKIAIDEHGPPFDPDTGERMILPESVTRLRAYLARRVPSLADAPVIESRVCQYENTSNGDFLSTVIRV